MRISDWSSDVCSSDLQIEQARARIFAVALLGAVALGAEHQYAVCGDPAIATRQQARAHRLRQRRGLRNIEAQLHRGRYLVDVQIGRASCRERVCKYV